ncbi:MAG TPA: polyprenyl synthetase family protein [Acidimicrobiales bacterium]|nr:polyprenyl synthetase family protein [Acidimicrobiales bacterium]
MTTSLVPPGSGGASQVPAPEALARAAAIVVPALFETVERLDPSLHEPVRHHLAAGGKHVRAGLVLVCTAAVGGSEADGLPGAVAVELVHNYSLLHDDIIDGDRERRHRPTVWAVFGKGVAIIAGDALAALAMQALLDEPTPSRTEAARRLADANQGMISGQSADMAYEARPHVTVEECLAMERAKTGALLSAACAIGAVLGGADRRTADALGEYGEHLGIAFQAVDDLLGVWGDPAVTGKPVGADLLARKKALPVAVAFERGGEVADELAAIFSGPPDAAEVERATQLLARAGVRDEVSAIAEHHLRAALEALDRAQLEDEPKEELVDIARYVTARDR